MANNPQRNQSNSHSDPNLQLSIPTNDISELLGATKMMTRYFKKSYKSGKSHHNYSNISHNSSFHSDKHTSKTHNPNDQVNKITGQTWTCKSTKSEPEDNKDPDIFDSPDKNLAILSHKLMNYWGQIRQHEICHKFPFSRLIGTTLYLCLIQGQLCHVCLRHASTNYNSNQN